MLCIYEILYHVLDDEYGNLQIQESTMTTIYTNANPSFERAPLRLIIRYLLDQGSVAEAYLSS